MLYGKLEKSCNSCWIKLVVIILDETNYCKYAYMSIYVYLDEFILKNFFTMILKSSFINP